jgi:hypothetical protein
MQLSVISDLNISFLVYNNDNSKQEEGIFLQLILMIMYEHSKDWVFTATIFTVIFIFSKETGPQVYNICYAIW